MMERTRAIEIIEAHGADPARWPDPERDGVKALLSADLPLRRLLDEAATLDAALTRWSQNGPADDETAARTMAESALAAAGRPAPRWRMAAFFGSVAVAASLVGAILVAPSMTTPTAPVQPVAPQQVATAQDAAAIDNQIWSMTFTPTPEEESLI